MIYRYDTVQQYRMFNLCSFVVLISLWVSCYFCLVSLWLCSFPCFDGIVIFWAKELQKCTLCIIKHWYQPWIQNDELDVI